MRIIIILFLLVQCCAAQTLPMVNGQMISTNPRVILKKQFVYGQYVILAGQSNADGRPEADAVLSAYSLPNFAIRFINYENYNLSAPYSYWRFLDETSSTQWGPEISMGPILATNSVAAIIKVGIGSTSLAVDWAASGASWATLQGVRAYGLDVASNSLGLVLTNCAGIFLMHGESDATNATWAAAYYVNLTNIITRSRTLVGNANCPFLIGRITPYYGAAADNAAVRYAQALAASNIAYTGWVDTDSISNGAHYSSTGLVTLGQDFVQAWLEE